MKFLRLLTISFIIGSLILIVCKSNKPPEVPSIPSGPDSGVVDNYTFFTWSSDPDGDSIAIKFDWGDGSESNWSSLVGSGDTVAMSHFYNKEGRYEIRAKAKDIQNAESDWSEPHILNIGTEIFWTKEYGGNLDDYGYAITISLDNCYVIAGATNSYGAGGYDVYLIKIDTTGGIVWEKTYGGSGDDYGYSVRTMNDGGFIIAGMTKSFGDENGDLYLIKVDAQGNLVWQKNYGGAYADYGYDLTISPDGYAITGMTGSSGAGSGDVWLLKTNFNGDTVWTKTFGGIDLECGNSIQLCNDNGYIITGYTYSLGANGDVYLVKTDANGEVLWTRNYGGNGQDMGNMVKETADNGYVVVGGNGNVYVLKIDNSGNRVWEKTYGTNYTDNGYAIEQLSDGKYYVVGSAGVNGSDLYYLCLDEAGNLIKEKNYGDFQYEYGRFLLIDGSTAIIGGYRLNNLMRNNVYVIKIKR